MLTSCEEVIEWDIPENEDKSIVIEAIITNEMKRQEIVLSSSFTDLNGLGEAIQDAECFVTSKGQVIEFQEISPGKYLSLDVFAIEIGKKYKLLVKTGGKEFEAISEAVENAPVANFPFVRHNQTDSVYIANVGVDYSQQEQAMYDFNIDWKHLEPDGKNEARLKHFVFNSVNIGQLFGPEKERLLFPRGSVVIKRKYALNEDFAEYLRGNVIESQWKGGFFEEASGNLKTNLNNGALGFFAVCSVQSDTLIAGF